MLFSADLTASRLACTVAGCPVLAPDRRERGMPGDSCAIRLGFLSGAEIVRRLPEIWLLPAALVVIGLNVLAETVTFTRTVDAVPPLRWFDRLGRLPDATS